MRLRLASTMALVATAASPLALAAPAGTTQMPSAFELRDGEWVRKPTSCGTPMVGAPIADDAAARTVTPVFAAGEPRVVYLNKNGGDYTGSTATNAATNQALTNIIPFGVTAHIPALDETTFDWATLRDCVAAHYAPFNVTIVETEPTSGTYVEAVIGGTPEDLFPTTPPPEGLLGIASTPNVCVAQDTGIAFSLSEAHKGIPSAGQELCSTVAHEVGHVLGLEHETLARDNMSYVPYFQAHPKSFIDMDSACGTIPGQEAACACGGANTNSGRRLYQFIGAANPTPPTMTILDPGDGAQLDPGFTVTVQADEQLKKVELLIDNALVGALTAEPYTFTAPADLADGTHTVTARGTDNEYTTGNAEITVQIGDGGGGGGCAAGGGTGGASTVVLLLGLAGLVRARRSR